MKIFVGQDDFESMSAKQKIAAKKEAEVKRNTLDSLIPVQLSDEDMAEFVRAFHPKRAAKAPQAFMDEFLFLTEVSAYINSIFTGLRYGLHKFVSANGGLNSEELGQAITREIELTYAATKEQERIAKAFMMNIASGSHHIIRDSLRYKGGKDIIYSGLRGPNISPLLHSEHPTPHSIPVVTTSYTYRNMEASFATEFGKALIETGKQLQGILLGEGQNVAEIKSAYSRISMQHEISAAWNPIARLTKLFASGPLAKIGVPVLLPEFEDTQTEHAVSRLSKYVSVLVLREPNYTVVQQRARNADLPDESLDVCIESAILQPDIRFSIAVNLPKTFCEYITQTKNEQIPLVPLNTWVTVWSMAMLRPPRTRSGAEGRSSGDDARLITPHRAPRYVLRPSASDELLARRKELGLYSEKGRVNDDGLMITYNGDLSFVPTSEDTATSNAKAYEALMEEALSISFDAGTPLAAGQRGSTGLIFDVASPNYAGKIQALKDRLSMYKGSVQAINWDLNTVLTVSLTDPDRLVSTKLTGGATPDAVNLATYLRLPLGQAMRDMFSRSRVTLPDGKSLHMTSVTFESLMDGIRSSSLFENFGILYNHLLKQQLVPSLQDLVKKAAEALKISSLEDESVMEYELNRVDTAKTIYGTILGKDLTVSADVIDVGGTLRLLFAVAAHQASAAAGTTLAWYCIKNNVEFSEHDRYYNGKTNTAGELGKVYQWFGAQVFLQAVKAILSLPRKTFVDLAEVPLDPANPNDKYPNFLAISREVLPMCVVYGKYVMPEIRDAIYKQADTIVEDRSKFTEQDLNLAGSRAKSADGKGGMKLFPHQAIALSQLKAHPKIAILDIAPGGGKCLAPTSLVPTKSGLLTLGELWEASNPVDGRKDIRQLSVKVSTIGGDKSTDGVYTTRGKTRCVLLKDGTEFIGLPEHRMYALDEQGRMDFVRLDQMRAGTYLPKAVGTRIFPTKVPSFAEFKLSDFHINTRNACQHTKLPTRLTLDFAQLLGLLVAEGYTPSGSDGVAFHNHDQDVLDFYSHVLQSEFNIEQPCQQNANGKNVAIRLHNAYVGAFFSSILVRGLSAEKQVPMVIRQAPEDYQCAFLRGLFEGDGTIGNGVRARISYCSISKTMAHQVKAMLENIGIYCSIKSAFKSATNGHPGNSVEAFAVKIWEHSSNIQLFNEKIGFMSDRKQSRLTSRLAHIEQLDSGQNTNQFAHGPYNKVPCLPEYTALIARIEALLSEASYSVAFGNQSRTVSLSLDKVLAENGHRRKSIAAKSNVVTRYNIDTLFAILDSLGRELAYVRRDQTVVELRKVILHLASFIWVPVVDTKVGKTLQVFDLSVPDNHTYVVNGYLGHNTTIGVADIACLYADGLIKRPFVFCPPRLVRNWVEDLHKSFKGWNAIPVTTETYAEWGEERLTELIQNAPPNTVIVVGNSFISNTPKQQLVIGNTVDTLSNAVEFCKKFEPDYVIIDESHRIRNTTSAIHQGIKTIMQMSSVKYGRIATGTLIQNVLSDVVGQSAVFNGQIFRTTQEFEATHKGVVAIVNDKQVVDYFKDTPFKARRRLSDFATVISFKRKEWAFMLPMPIETFITVNMDEHGDLGHMLQQFYNAVLKKTLEEAKNDPKLKNLKKGAKDEDEEETSEETHDRTVTNAAGTSVEVSDDDDDSEDTDNLEAALQPYLQRLERLLTDPFGDEDLLPVAKEIFGDAFAEDYVTPKVQKVIDRIRMHFAPNEWQKGKEYAASDIADFNGKTYIYKSDLPAGSGRERSDMSPDSDTTNWKPQIRGKIFIACRYTRSVEAIFRALPKELRDRSARFHGDVDNKDESLNKFQNDPNTDILIGNEMGISEGHNFQMATRFIRVEAPWAPGELDQTASRIFRPDVGGEYTRQTIFLDWILCDNTLEVAKMGRLISKMLKRAQFDELDNPKYFKGLNPANLPIIKMSLDNIRSLYKVDDLCSFAGEGSIEGVHSHSYIGQYQFLVSEMGREFAEMRTTRRAYMLDVEPTPMPEGSSELEFTPWVPNLKVEDKQNDGLIPLKAALESGDLELAQAFKKDPRAIIGQFVRTEFGLGTITRVTTTKGRSTEEDGDDIGRGISKVQVALAQGGNVEMLSASKVYLATNITERSKSKYNKKAPKITEADKERTAPNRKKAEAAVERIRVRARKSEETAKVAARVVRKQVEKETAEAKREIALYPVIYNEFLALEGMEDDADSKALRRFGFTRFGNYAWLPIKTYQNFTAVLEFLEKSFTLDPKTVRYLDSLHDSFQSGRGRKFAIELAPTAELPQFYRMRHRLTQIKNRKRPELKLYPVIINGSLMLVVDLATNPIFRKYLNKSLNGVTGANKFQEADGMDIHFFTTKSQLISKVRELRKNGFTITNLDELKSEVESLNFKTKSSKS